MEFFQHHGTPRKPAKDLKGGPYRMCLEEATAVRDHWQDPRLPRVTKVQAEYGRGVDGPRSRGVPQYHRRRVTPVAPPTRRKLARFVEDVRIDVLAAHRVDLCPVWPSGRQVLRHPDPLSAESITSSRWRGRRTQLQQLATRWPLSATDGRGRSCDRRRGQGRHARLNCCSPAEGRVTDDEEVFAAVLLVIAAVLFTLHPSITYTAAPLALRMPPTTRPPPASRRR